MAKKPKPAATLVLPHADWPPLQEAYDRAKAATGSRAFAVRDLERLLSDARKTLPSAMRAIGHDGVEICKLLDPSFWPEYKITCDFATIRVWCRDAINLAPDSTRFEEACFTSAARNWTNSTRRLYWMPHQTRRATSHYRERENQNRQSTIGSESAGGK
jgi:hypothetical protein